MNGVELVNSERWSSIIRESDALSRAIDAGRDGVYTHCLRAALSKLGIDIPVFAWATRRWGGTRITRIPEYVETRDAVCHALREAGMSFPEIAHIVYGTRSHSTAFDAVERHRRRQGSSSRPCDDC